MAKETPSRIRLKGRDDYRNEGVAGGAITPGDAVEVTGESSGASPDPVLQRQSVAADGGTALLFAIEYASTGRTIDDDIQAGDNMFYFPALPGERYLAHHNTAEDVAYGDELVLAGDGTFRALDTAGGDAEAAVRAEARSAVSNATGTAKQRLTVEVTR